MAGCVLFDLVGQAGSRLFADEPEVAERITMLYNEILTDEIGHVGYCAARCSDRGRAIMRGLYPVRSVDRPSDPCGVRRHRTPTLTERISRPFDFGDMTDRLPTTTFIAAHP